MLPFESSVFRKVYATEKINNWCEQISKLSEFAKTQPHATYSAFCDSEVQKFTCFLKTICRMQSILIDLMI